MRRFLRGSLCVFAALAAGASLFSTARAEDSPAATHKKLVERSLAYLRTAQDPNGAFSASTGPAVTALVTTAVLKSGVSPKDPLVARSLSYILGFVQKDGGIYNGDQSPFKNYETCMAIQCLAEANQGGKYDKVLKAAEAAIRGQQWDESEDKNESELAYGGAGYGNKKRPDLSNTSFFLDTLKSIGAGEDDPAVKKALIFISRCQNLESEHNTTPFPALVNDGGFYYTPANDGESQAGKEANGGLRSYASMTYAGLKSMIYCGVSKDDARVKAAHSWLQKHYDLDSNPGMADNGLYYYYHTFAKALDAMGEETFVDAEGNKHPWRAELLAELASRQREDGSWINDNKRWLEGDPNLVTGYALLALSYTQPKKAGK